MNQFADLSLDEIQNMRKIIPKDLSNENKGIFTGNDEIAADAASLPASIDWRTKNAVTGVMNEGQCGSTLFITVKESLEGIYALKNGKLYDFSTQ